VSRASDRDTIAAAATPPGPAGVAIVRLSGPHALEIASAVAGKLPAPHEARLRVLSDEDGEILDRALVLVFPAPHSFTGEDTVEFQLHGSPVLTTLLLRRLTALGAREAGPGEFTRRAYMNGRIDLAQAEAIADLIASASVSAARAAMRSLEGEFSARVMALVEATTQVRIRLEAGLDFPEEGVDHFDETQLAGQLDALQIQIGALYGEAQQGRALRDGLSIVIAGAPNAGKSSLLNRLAGYEAAIVTEIPGTTRDLVREDILIDGMPVKVADTAGLRDDADRVEAEGIRRARAAMSRADLVLLVEDATAAGDDDHLQSLPEGTPVLLIRNKIDLSGEVPAEDQDAAGRSCLRLSALTGAGMELLRARLKAVAGYSPDAGGSFSARRRHLDALARAADAIRTAADLLAAGHSTELAAEELRLAQHSFGEITGEFTTEDLLGRIFSEFCIGK
jgi:tRNA modification GTPase